MPNIENLNGWVGVIGAVIAILIALLKRAPETANLNADTIKKLTESIAETNDNYSKVQDRVAALEKTVTNQGVHIRALMAQLTERGIKPVTLEEALAAYAKLDTFSGSKGA